MKFGHINVRWAGEEGIVARRGPVLVVNYRGAISQKIMQAAEQAQRDILAAHGGACLMLSVVESGLPLPDETARTGIIAHFRTMSAKNTAYAAVVLGDGFWASAARSILSTFALVVRAQCPALTSTDVAAGAKFLASHAPAASPVDAAMLASEIAAMRRAAEREPVLAEA